MANKRKICCIPGCREVQRAMGLCGTHYNGLYRLVASGETTWDELEARGICKRIRKRKSNARAIAGIPRKVAK